MQSFLKVIFKNHTYSHDRFTTKGEKFQHTKSVHKSGYKCTTCAKVFDRPALLQRHLAKHTGKKPYKCSLCSYQTPNKANAKRHIEKKHSDVQEGSILFVTDDGEQIQIEVVSRNSKEADQRSFLNPSSQPSMQSAAAVVRSNADSTSFNSNAAEISNLTSPRSRSESVTSSSLSPPGHLFVGPFTSVFDASAATDIRDYAVDRKRKITHSIDMIMREHTQSHFQNKSVISATSTSVEGSSASVTSPENFASPPCFQSCNFHNINELQLGLGRYCSPNWSHSSSLFSINNDYTAARNNAQQAGLFQENNESTYTSSESAETRNQGSSSSSSFLFRQCMHGCWHHIDNQITSDLPCVFEKDATSSSFLTPSRYFTYTSPDLRSSSSSMSQRTENSSIISLKSEDENDSDIIDVVGDDDDDDDDEDDDGDDRSRKLQLNTICKSLGSFSTAETTHIREEEGSIGENEMKHLNGSTPVELTSQRRNSFTCGSSGGSSVKKDQDSSGQYVPKKLRLARAYHP